MKNKIFPTVQSPDNDVWYGVQSIVVNHPWQVEGTLNVNAKSIVGTLQIFLRYPVLSTAVLRFPHQFGSNQSCWWHYSPSLTVQSNLALRTFSVRAILVLKVKIVLILTVIYYINHQLVIGDLVLKVKQVLILTVLKAKFDCTLNYQIIVQDGITVQGGIFLKS